MPPATPRPRLPGSVIGDAAPSITAAVVAGAASIGSKLFNRHQLVRGVRAVSAVQANPFVQMIGVNTHLSYSGSSYNNTTTVLNALSYLNVWQIRDYALINGLANMPGSYNTVAAAGGKFVQEIGTGFARSTVSCVTGVENSTFANIDSFVTSYPGSVLAIEGPNEINNAGVQYIGTFTATGHSGATINAASTPAGLQAVSSSGYGWQVTLTDLTTAANIPSGTIMSSATATTVVASAAVAVANGDVIQYYASFQNPASAILWQQDFYALTHADSHLTGLGVEFHPTIRRPASPVRSTSTISISIRNMAI